jgi:hypothetical protein
MMFQIEKRTGKGYFEFGRIYFGLQACKKAARSYSSEIDTEFRIVDVENPGNVLCEFLGGHLIKTTRPSEVERPRLDP